METLKKGQKVAVNTISGRVVRRVWEDLGWAVEICSDRQFAALESGDYSVQAIGFRRKDVEACD
jgi:hypothetical protein